MRARPFLTARWEHLAILSWGVDESLLRPHLPPGLELDCCAQLGGRPFVSLVAFDFVDTRVLGRRWPWHVNFPEINLRFYVRDPAAEGERRGVCFIRELVPRRVIATVARWFYNEPYDTASMSSRVSRARGDLSVEHSWCYRGIEHRLRVEADDTPFMPEPGTIEHWFKEHEWGFGRGRRGTRLTYRVEHPVWAVYPVRRADYRIDFASLYGPQWGMLGGRSPDSTVLAAGSEVRVFPRA